MLDVGDNGGGEGSGLVSQCACFLDRTVTAAEIGGRFCGGGGGAACIFGTILSYNPYYVNSQSQ